MTPSGSSFAASRACRCRRPSDAAARFTSLSLSFDILPPTVMNGVPQAIASYEIFQFIFAAAKRRLFSAPKQGRSVILAPADETRPIGVPDDLKRTAMLVGSLRAPTPIPRLLCTANSGHLQFSCYGTSMPAPPPQQRTLLGASSGSASWGKEALALPHIALFRSLDKTQAAVERAQQDATPRHLRFVEST
jgi:hypothetical protein